MLVMNDIAPDRSDHEKLQGFRMGAGEEKRGDLLRDASYPISKRTQTAAESGD